MWVIVYVLATITGVDLALCWLLLPSTNVLILGILISLFLTLEALAIKLCKKDREFTFRLLKIQVYIVAFWTFIVFFLIHNATSAEKLKWRITKMEMDIVNQLLIDFYSKNGDLPLDLALVCNDRCRPDPYGDGMDLCYRYLGAGKCVLYSVGPDGQDDKGEIELANDAVQYSSKVLPWPLMPFGEAIYSLSGYDSRLKGDIVMHVTCTTDSGM